jgi:hypothetical protein
MLSPSKIHHGFPSYIQENSGVVYHIRS